MNDKDNPINYQQKKDYDKQHAMLQWLNRNRRSLLSKYKDQYIAYNEKGLIAHSESLQNILEKANSQEEEYLIYLVPKTTASIQILPIHFRSVVRHEWLPNYSVKLKHQEFVVKATMLVDSGAEVSLITHKVGQDLGYALADSESTLLAETIGGTVEYVLRNVEMTINNHVFIAPVAWLQNSTGGEQLLLGREVVFDRFNVEFRQSEEKIIFTWIGELLS